MTLNLSKENRIYKKLFNLKPVQKDGLVINLHHTDKNSLRIRFTNNCFDKTGQILALTDNEGNIFVIDFNTNKFWNLPKVANSCTIIKFSGFKNDEVLVGVHGGDLHAINIQTGFISGTLKGHECPVSEISFADALCLTASTSEAILWDLKTNTKLQVLKLDHCCTLKYVSFIPVTSNILTCYNDDFIQVWQLGTFEIKTQIPPLVWFNHEVKSFTFTKDGKVMVIACRTPHLALFLLSNFKLLKFITLPEYIQSLKHVDFIPQMNDGGSNRILAILSGRGTLYFYDAEQNIIISELVATYEILKCSFSSAGSFLACVLCSGDVNVFDVMPYTVMPQKLKPVRAETLGKSVRLRRCLEKIAFVKEKIREVLDFDKLKLILRECGEYPESYRMKIWEQLLLLPNNKHQYNAIINHRMIISFEDLCRKYPLENKRSLKNLKQLLDNLVTWCPFFLHVDYLPLFVFPFVKVFINKPLTCFEAVCCVIINWCQFWFEYFPLPPVNVLAMVENVLMENDPELLGVLTKKNISAELYAWPILRTAFSEVLTAKAWKIFWDHVLTNEPAFLLCAVVAYNILHKQTLMSFKEENQFKCFYNTHHPVDVKKLVSKTYHVLGETSEAIHPRQYLSLFKKINVGEYPNFCEYPKTVIEIKTEQDNDLKEKLSTLKMDEVDLFRQRLLSLDRMDKIGLDNVEESRIVELEHAVRKQLLDEQERVQNHHERLAMLRQRFHEEDKVLASLRGKIAKEQQMKNRRKYLSSVLDDAKYRKRDKTYKLTEVEDELLLRYSELLKNKYRIQQLLHDEEQIPTSTRISTDQSILDRHQEELVTEINNVRQMDEPREYLRALNLATGLEALDALIGRIEAEVDQNRGYVDENLANKRVVELQVETKELASEVDNLIQMLADLRNMPMGE